MRKTVNPKSIKCPCGNDATYNMCCGVIHLDSKKANSAEDLMRSRYTAFTLGMGAYLNDTHYRLTRNESEKKSIEDWSKSVKWLGLDILKSTLGKEGHSTGTVEFKAHFKEGLFKKVIHENSTFIKENESWYYVSAL